MVTQIWLKKCYIIIPQHYKHNIILRSSLPRPSWKTKENRLLMTAVSFLRRFSFWFFKKSGTESHMLWKESLDSDSQQFHQYQQNGHIESNTGKSARQGNLTRGCQRFPCLAFFAGVSSYFSLLSAVFSFVFVCWQLCTFGRRSCKQCELFPLHVNQKK
jgi:hypothetical protein